MEEKVEIFETKNIRQKTRNALDTENANQNSNLNITIINDINKEFYDKITFIVDISYENIINNIKNRVDCDFILVVKNSQNYKLLYSTKKRIKVSDFINILEYVNINNLFIISNNLQNDPRFIKDSIFERGSNILNIEKVICCYIQINNDKLGFLIIGSFSQNKKKVLLTPKDYNINQIYDLYTQLKSIGLIIKYGEHGNNIASDILKDKFFLSISHEIKTPLGGIMNMLSMISSAGPLNMKQTEYLNTLTECSFQLSSLMNNILDYSKIISGRFYLSKQSFNLGAVIKDSLRMVEGSALKKELIIEKDVPSKRDPIMLIGDPQRIMQIFTNILSNAIKFTDKGYISIKVKCRKIENLESGSSSPQQISPSTQTSFIQTIPKVEVIVEVEDTGIGIPYDEQSKIFEMFHQVQCFNNENILKNINVKNNINNDTSNKNNINNNISNKNNINNENNIINTNGTGLGLSITRELIRLMNGDITVKSDGIKGKGSIFTFNLILEEELNSNTMSKENLELLRGIKILIVDDRLDIRLQLCEMLMKWGCIPFMASSAEEGLKYINCGMIFNIIIIDICMPYISGVEMAQELKKTNVNIPLIGISSVELKEGKEYFDFYMHKPIKQTYLFSSVLKCIKNISGTPNILMKKNIRDINYANSNTNNTDRKYGGKINSNMNDIVTSIVVDKSSQPKEYYDKELNSKIKYITPTCSNSTSPSQHKYSIDTYPGININSNNQSPYNLNRKSHHPNNSYNTTPTKSQKHKNSKNAKKRLSLRPKKLKKDLKILILDDDKNSYYVIKELLSNLSYKNYRRAEYGEECFNIVNNALIKGEEYDVVLINMKLQKYNNINVNNIINDNKTSDDKNLELMTQKSITIAAIKTINSLRILDICPYMVAISSAFLNSDKDFCKDMGIEGYLSVPLTKEKIEEVLNVLVKQ